MIYPRHTDARNIIWEFDYVVAQFDYEHDALYYRELHDPHWTELPEWASAPDHINEHFGLGQTKARSNG